jgi:small-conductance mechanosensitive channel
MMALVTGSEEPVHTLRHLFEAAEAMTGLPRNALFATGVLVLGWLLAMLARALVARFVREVERLLSGRSVADEDGDDRLARARVDQLLGRGAFYIVVLLTLMIATELLGLPVITTWLGVIAAYLPRILMGVVIVFTGIVLGSLGRGALARALPETDHVDPERLGGVVQALVVGVSILVAVQQLGIDVGFLTTVVTIALIGFFGATALAFGFGGRTTVSNILAGHYVRELYEIGHTVRIQGLEGRIVRMTPTALIVSSDEGETAVPFQLFVDSLSTRVASRGRT